jgi:hypothetical protein
MAKVTVAGTRENPLAVGGHWRITNVGWPVSGYYVVVSATAEYDVGNLGSRRGTVEITAAGKKLGGRIIDQKNIDEPEDLVGTDTIEPHPARSRMIALLQFSKPLDLKSNDTCFRLHLVGSIGKQDPLYPDGSSQPFCGTTTTTTVTGNIFTRPTPGNESIPQFFRSVTNTFTTPGSTEVISYELGPLADLTVEDVGKGGFTQTGSSTSIWYIDKFGNYVNTNKPCSELPTPGPTPPPATKTEGWKLIEVHTFPKKGFVTLPAKLWTFETPAEAIVFAEPTNPIGPATPSFDGFMMYTYIPPIVVGTNSDFLPIFDDLPGGDYDFRVVTCSFNKFTAQVPPQKKPKNRSEDVWNLPGAYPLSPALARYDVRIGTQDGGTYVIHASSPVYDSTTPAPFLPGQAPPSSQNFTP